MTVLSDDSNFLTWNAWKEGDAFALGVQDVEGNPAGAYEALNMQVYVDGSLGVRPWLRNWNPAQGDLTSLNPSFYGAIIVPGQAELTLYVMTNQPSASGSYAGFLWTDTLGLWDRRVPDNISGSAMNVDPDSPAGGTVGGLGRMGLYPLGTDHILVGGEYDVNPVASASTTLTFPASWDPSRFAVYKNRAYTWDDASNQNRIHYSEVNDYETWGALDFFDLTAAGGTDGGVVLSLWALSDALLIGMDNGDWYALTGASPETGTLRLVGTGRRLGGNSLGVVFKDRLMFLEDTGSGGITVVTPSGQDLALDDVRPRRGMRPLADDASINSPRIAMKSAVASYLHDSLHFHYIRYHGTFADDDWGRGPKAIELINGAWNMTGYWMSAERTDCAGNFGDSALGGSGDLFSYQMMYNDRALVFVTQENVTANPDIAPQIYTRDVVLNRPSRSDDYWSDKIEILRGTGATTTHRAAGEVRLRNISAPDGDLIRVARVIVDATYWKDGSLYETPAITAWAVGPAGEQQLTVHGWSGASLADVSDDAGARTRIRFSAPVMPFEDEVRVELRGIQSLALRSVTVEFETEAFLDA